MVGTGKKNTWLVTGSSNGIGLALVRYILETGDNVIATSRKPTDTPELVKEIESRPNGRWTTLDISWPQDKVTKAIAEADEFFEGGITAIVNNAAFFVIGAIEDIPEEDAKASFDVNVWGTLRVCKAIIPLMRQRGAGTIVQISSLLGLTSWPVVGYYSASKYALEGLSETIAQEVSSFGIRVLIVNPGGFRTNFLGAKMNVIEPSDPYKAPHVVAKGIQGERDSNGKQPGDPKKAAKAIHEAVSGINPKTAGVMRLPLGEDCWNGGIRQLDRIRKDFDAAKEVSYGTKFTSE